MKVMNPQKTVCPKEIVSGDSLILTICFDTAKECGEECSLVLAMDVSGSMGGFPICKAAEAAGELICSLMGKNSEARMALVSYADRAELEVPLTRDKRKLLEGLSDLRPRGNTCHGEAFHMAGQILRNSKGRKILILFTDGPSNCGDSDREAEKLRSAGVEIFCIGLEICADVLRPWASCPENEHIALACCPCGLRSAFLEIGNAIPQKEGGKAELFEKVSEGFYITGIEKISCGRAEKLDDRTIRWLIDPMEAGKKCCLSLKLRYEGCGQGITDVNADLSYRDSFGNCLLFKSPQVHINSRKPIPGGPCSEPVEIRALPCRDIATGPRADAVLSGLGRIVEVDAVIRDVCPGRAVAAAILLTEVDPCGNEHNRGFKTFEIPGKEGDSCEDVFLNCVPFVVPESTGFRDKTSLCKERIFKARVLANYLDTDFSCCRGEGKI